MNRNQQGTPSRNHDHLRAMLQQEAAYLCQFDYMKSEREQHLILLQNTYQDDLSKVPSDASIGDITQDQSRQFSDNKGSHQQQQHDSTTSPPPQCRLPQQSMQYWREQMFDWSCMVVDSFGADRDVVAVSFNLLDRYLVHELQRPLAPSVTRDDYQLFAMTCLYIAVKVLEPYPRKLSVQTLVEMSKQFYTAQIIEQTERDILVALGWRLHAPTALAFARMYSTLLFSSPNFPIFFSSQKQSLFQTTLRTITELSVVDTRSLMDRPSHIGLSAVLLAAQQMGIGEVASTWRLQWCEENTANELSRVFTRLQGIYWE